MSEAKIDGMFMENLEEWILEEQKVKIGLDSFKSLVFKFPKFSILKTYIYINIYIFFSSKLKYLNISVISYSIILIFFSESSYGKYLQVL